MAGTGKRRKLKEYADPNIGFAWLRLFGAITVVIDHSSPLVHPERLTIFPASWHASPGYVALMGFFAMSGWQISDSWERDPSWWRFSGRRLLRILPPLLAVVFVTTFVIGPLFTSLTVGEYFADQQTWRYLVGTSLLFLLQHLLPGVFDDNPYPWSVNGSLWTLPMEMVGYVLVLVVGLLVAFGVTRYVVLPVLAGLMVLDGMFQATFGFQGNAGSLIEVPIGSMVSFMVPFAIGMVIHTFRDRIPLNGPAAIVLFAGWIAAHWTPLDRYLLAISASYGAIVIAHHWPTWFKADGRLVFGSYGLYIWAFPVQQMIIAAGVHNQWVLMALAVPAAYLCGVASWCLVEAPTQRRLRKYLVKPKPPRQPRPPSPRPPSFAEADTVRFSPVARPPAGRRPPSMRVR
ncbi:acyltransferase family protein [Prauserella flavalba]|uniref:Acyltransferase n=1 Tax=Prauserella flavalba TaxID=1477506 RepID=A0A318MEL6_9PSEU|nr:acyltransferase family protein [Prauserella flavalba]PXY37540.1 acyltransferase [Prauserella flavalba]